MVRIIIQIESFLIFITAVYFYYTIQGNWILFAVLFLTPDISMIGYLKDKKLGSLIYNIVHNYASALLLCGLGIILNNQIIIFTGLILLTHVSLDRFFGFGLKYPANFKETHIQKL